MFRKADSSANWLIDGNHVLQNVLVVNVLVHLLNSDLIGLGESVDKVLSGIEQSQMGTILASCC